MPAVFSVVRHVEFAETDMAGIVHFSNYFKWMESCETAFLRSLGVPLIDFVPGQAVGWPRVNARCDYRAPLRFGDVVEVALAVHELRTRAIVLRFTFRRVVAGQVAPEPVAEGELTVVCVTGDGRGGMVAQPIPPEIRAKLGAGAS
jgi:YbgC/YbaW family acyl-CoA thioester hydrolase